MSGKDDHVTITFDNMADLFRASVAFIAAEPEAMCRITAAAPEDAALTAKTFADAQRTLHEVDALFGLALDTINAAAAKRNASA